MSSLIALQVCRGCRELARYGKSEFDSDGTYFSFIVVCCRTWDAISSVSVVC